MSDSSSFTSLFALVDSHLSKTSLQNADEANGRPRTIPIPSLSGVQKGLSDAMLPSHSIRLPLPQLSLSESPITSILAEQLSNTFKARERKKQEEEERQRLEDEMKRMKLVDDKDNEPIDLMKALLTPYKPPPKDSNEVLSSSSSLESLFDQNEFDIGIIDLQEPINILQEKHVNLPCKTDMTYILEQKIPRAKCSAFGKVLISKLRPVAAPYLRDKTVSKIVPFDFKTKSPDDLIKEKMRLPTGGKRFNVMDKMSEIMGHNYSFTD